MRTASAKVCDARAPMLRSMVAACLALCVAILVLSAPARAQDPSLGSSEVPIGTFNLGAPRHDGFSVVEPPAGLPERRREESDGGSGRWFFQNWQTTPSRDALAERLYESAMVALKDGQRERAQRLFEQLIADAPESPKASVARQQLGRIYRSIDASFHSSPAGRTADDNARSELPWAETPPAARPVVSRAPSRLVLHQARVSPALDGQFLAEAGDRVFFSAGSSALGARARSVLQSQARFLKRYPYLYAAVEGFADDGSISEEETLRLSEERAAVVRARLVAEGVNEQRILAYGRAREDRVSDCPQPECMAQNRRVVTIILSRKVDPGPLPRRAQGGPAPQNVSPTQ